MGLTHKEMWRGPTSASHLFGDGLEDFASEVRELVFERSPAGLFWDWPGNTENFLARKPQLLRGSQSQIRSPVLRIRRSEIRVILRLVKFKLTHYPSEIDLDLRRIEVYTSPSAPSPGARWLASFRGGSSLHLDN